MQLVLRIQNVPRFSINADAVARSMSVAALGLVSTRVAAGRDIFDKPFKSYSTGYARGLRLEGHDTHVDLSLSGGLMQSLHVASAGGTQKGVKATITVDASSSRVVPILPPFIKDSYRRRWRQLMLSKRLKGAPHNVVAAYLQNGTDKMPARPWLGLSPSDIKKLEATLQDIMQQAVIVT